MLAACGGGEGSALDKQAAIINASSAISSAAAQFSTGNSTSSVSSINTTTVSDIGIGTGASFISKKIGIEYDTQTETLSAGGTTTLTVNLISNTGTLASQSVTVTFNSTCVSGNTAVLGSAVVTTTNGTASTTYTAKGCGYDHKPDLITATATFTGGTLVAQTTLTVDADTVQTIAFKDASPALINIKGTGGLETSILRFQVVGQRGAPIKGVCVKFTPNTTQGGLALVPSTCTPSGGSSYESLTDAEGYAITTVQSGTVSTPVRVTATTDNGKTTQSSNLVVTTGIPDQNSFSMGPENLSPVSWHYDKIETDVTVLLADAFNNLVPNGTAITFTTSGGSIGGSCVTTNGACSVKWRSQSPRPTSFDPVIFSDTTLAMRCTSGAPECRSGRVRLLATAIGNESFIDGTGNGVYDDIEKDIFITSNGRYTPLTRTLTPINTPLCDRAEPMSSAAYGVINSCDDLREAYVDKDFDGIHDDIEEIIDFNQDGLFDSKGNGKYDGILCAGAAKLNGDCTTNKVGVRAESLLVMSSQEVFLQPHGRLPGQPASFLVPKGQSATLSMRLADENGNGMPKGTTLSLKSSLVNASASVSPSGALPMSTEPAFIGIVFKADEDITKTPGGSLMLEITAPSESGGSLTTSIPVSIISN